MDEETFRLKLIEVMTEQVGFQRQTVKHIDDLCKCVATKADIERLGEDHKEMKQKLYTIGTIVILIAAALGITGLVF